MDVSSPDRGPMHGVVAVLLAAGAGSRFTAVDGTGRARHKLLARLLDDAVDDGLDEASRPTVPSTVPPTVFGRALHHAVEAGIGAVIVVVGAVDPTALAADPATAALLARDDVAIEANPRWAAGQSTSVQVGVEAARRRGATTVVIGLADQPFVTPDAWRAVAAGAGPITVATYDGRRGNPVRLHADVWDLLPTAGDEGARVLMGSRPDLVDEVPCSGSAADIDTVEDLHRWQNN